MLDLIRKKKKSFIIKIVFWAIIATFVGTIFLVWGRGGDRGTQPTDVAATVNGTEVSYGEFQQTYSNLYQLYQNVYREKFTPALEKQLGLRQQALDTLIDQTLLLQEAGRMGLEVEKAELIDAIAQIPAFQENGTFSKERYLQVLSYQRLTPDQFEALQRRELLIDKVRQRLQEGAEVTAGEVEEEYRRRNEKVNLAFIKLAPGLFEDDVKIDPEALQAFFEENREQFRLSEQVSLRYLQFEPERFRDEVTFEEGELEKFYRRHLDRYEIPEQVKAAHVLVKVPEDATPEVRRQKRELAEEILAKARAGEDFAELARTYSDDRGTVPQGGDLGFFARGAMVPAFEQAAFSLEPGEISEVVETPFGYHVIKSEAYVEAGVKPLADVVEEVKAGLRRQKARSLAFEKAMDAYNINRKDGSLEAAAAANDLGVKETGLFDREGVIDGIGREPEIIAAAFALGEGELARPVDLDAGVFLFTVKERRPSRLPELAEVRPRVEQAFRAAKARDLAQQATDKYLEQLRGGKKLSALAAEQGVEVQETGLFSRAYGEFVPKLGSAPGVMEAAFELTGEQPVPERVFESGKTFVLLKLKERQEPDPQGLDAAMREQLREALLSDKRDELMNERLESLRQQAKITIAPQLQATLEESPQS